MNLNLLAINYRLYCHVPKQSKAKAKQEVLDKGAGRSLYALQIT